MQSRQHVPQVTAATAPVAPLPAPGLVFVAISMVLGLVYALVGLAS
ncbi:hypothetical protein [Sandaracinus amylolyticus]|uniref:Uncharacterized protein n=1 Tax=Sandaracinus amylolyticus TaxID=927083 RepID=A0A0F6SGW0_9BACT|nr:hypothetical protein [Sandaracinus amylolyticus]AKF09379.1 hypothetical protein DB32_006528 [Sandaracinus amylolyticus]UJR87167.1 Hypothetical protein I5071_92680 [Sandaracinus amylolyticus]